MAAPFRFDLSLLTRWGFPALLFLRLILPVAALADPIQMNFQAKSPASAERSTFVDFGAGFDRSNPDAGVISGRLASGALSGAGSPILDSSSSRTNLVSLTPSTKHVLNTPVNSGDAMFRLPVPEPASLSFVGIGLAGLAVLVRYRAVRPSWKKL